MNSPPKLHIEFFPYMAPGHMIPCIDMARLFATHGVKVTIITTPLNAIKFSEIIERDRQLLGVYISTQTIKFPSEEAGLPEGFENLSSLNAPEMIPKWLKAMSLLQEPLEQVLTDCKPNCLLADMMFPWSNEVADKLRIPRLFFNGISCFAMCVYNCLQRYEPHKVVESDHEPFEVPGLPDRVWTTKLQLATYFKEDSDGNVLSNVMDRVAESELKSYGVVMNSFQELEPDYADYYKEVMGRKAWLIGPVSLSNRDTKDKAKRGERASIDEEYILKWLDSKEPGSVLYICFGSLYHFREAQVIELANALEASGQNFIWVVKKKGGMGENNNEEEWLPQGFERRVEEKGLVIRGWAPQVLILDHEAIGGFMTHCGWNSTLEGLTSGVPLLTWPLHAEQFFNEKLVTDVLKVGVGVGAQEWSRYDHEKKILVRKEEIVKAIIRLMASDETERFAKSAKEIQEMARKSIKEGGSSFSNIDSLLEELRNLGSTK